VLPALGICRPDQSCQWRLALAWAMTCGVKIVRWIWYIEYVKERGPTTRTWMHSSIYWPCL
jgi:hypothetical protein